MWKIELVNQLQIMEKGVCFHFVLILLEKNIAKQIVLSSLGGRQPIEEKANFKFKTIEKVVVNHFTVSLENSQ